MITLKKNELDVDTYLNLRASVNWKKLSDNQAQRALENSLCTICAYDGQKVVGMGRIVGDGAVICYIQDLIIIPEIQSKGVGGMILKRLIEETKKIGLKDTTIMLDLMCAKGREKFYEKYNFIARPTENLGPGMIQYLNL